MRGTHLALAYILRPTSQTCTTAGTCTNAPILCITSCTTHSCCASHITFLMGKNKPLNQNGSGGLAPTDGHRPPPPCWRPGAGAGPLNAPYSSGGGGGPPAQQQPHLRHTSTAYAVVLRERKARHLCPSQRCTTPHSPQLTRPLRSTAAPPQHPTTCLLKKEHSLGACPRPAPAGRPLGAVPGRPCRLVQHLGTDDVLAAACDRTALVHQRAGSVPVGEDLGVRME